VAVFLETGLIAIESGDVAEGAALRATARDLDHHGAVAGGVDQVPARERRVLEALELAAAIDVTATDRLRVSDHLLDQVDEAVFRLPEIEDRFPGDLLMVLSGEWAAVEDRRSELVGAGNDLFERSPVDDHRGGEDHIGPGDVLVTQRLDVAIDEPDFVVVGKHAGYGGETERGEDRPLVDQLEGLVVAPEGNRVLWIDEKCSRHRQPFY
jgi:hypothetical protein